MAPAPVATVIVHLTPSSSTYRLRGRLREADPPRVVVVERRPPRYSVAITLGITLGFLVAMWVVAIHPAGALDQCRAAYRAARVTGGR